MEAGASTHRGSCFCCRSGSVAPRSCVFQNAGSQEIVKRYSILISRALKSVKKTVRENYQEHANEVKSSADTREVFMPAPRRTGIAGSQQGACRWSGARRDPGLCRPAGTAPLPLDIATLSLGFFFFFSVFLLHWSLMIFPAPRELREGWR